MLDFYTGVMLSVSSPWKHWLICVLNRSSLESDRLCGQTSL
ncbi:unnamed protein product [Angiostrongylus costaricensis]|uniref:Uncharacterized protein n=1 Tax=Angiostrongylus costaricensis TaxID=334426 RepID=A0A0R3PEB2_ANGCS|nr:unnamed protein product [Angiostrongylus costaricensis]